jgi:hypothetical protein
MFYRLSLSVLFLASLPLAALADTCNTPNSLVKITHTKSGPWEFVDFYVKEPVTGTVALSAPTGPNFTEDPSDLPIFIPGNRWTEVRFSSMDWMCTTPTQFALPKPIVKSIKPTERFEGNVTYVIGRKGHHFMGSSWSTIGALRRLRLKFF